MLQSLDKIKKNKKVEKAILLMAEKGMDAMDELYSLISSDVYAFALSKVGNPHDADDIMQDTFVQIYRYAKRYVPEGKPLAWVFTIITNLANQRFRDNTKNDYLEDRVVEPADEKDFSESFINNEFLKDLLNTLANDEKEIIVMHVVSGMKHREIADFTGQPLSTVLSKYNRAMKKLQVRAKEVE
ncbi:MAG: RNA polymerase sigma factor [Lachnospiraceae bacterium]|nr:RNA polymerase sigma factor [Lachnospiraceae bacterium]